MKSSIVEWLRCPICHEKLALCEDGKRLAGEGNKPHSFDCAKSGYVNLARQGEEGDGKDAIRARTLFLNGGYYQKLADRISEIVTEFHGENLLDAGSGQGYYTERVVPNMGQALGIDLSRDGVDYASKQAKDKPICYVVGSIFDLPVQDNVFDCVMNLFAPCSESEFLRVLKPGGILLLVGAGEEHLMGLKKLLYENPYVNPGRKDLPQNMTLLRKENLKYEISVLGNQTVEALFSMTPYYWRTSLQDKEKLRGVEKLDTVVDFDIFVYRKDRV